MWQLVEGVEGLPRVPGAGHPITGGNVSLYNETDGLAIIRRRSLAWSG